MFNLKPCGSLYHHTYQQEHKGLKRAFPISYLHYISCLCRRPKDHLWWNLTRKLLSSEQNGCSPATDSLNILFQRLQHWRFEPSLISGVHSKRSKVQENKSDNGPCRYCVLELSYQKNLSACVPARAQFHTPCSPPSEMLFISLSLRHKHANRKPRPPSFIRQINCNESLPGRNTKKPFINSANAPVEVGEPLVPQFKELAQWWQRSF